ncbi:hypothetical protein D3C80_1404820 [compost metagenome]
MGVQRGAIGPLLDKNKMPRILMINKQFIGETKWLLPGFLHQFLIQRHHRFNTIELDKIFSNHF